MSGEWQEEGDGSRGSGERKDGIKEKERKIRMGAKRQKERRDTVNHRRTQGGRNHRVLLQNPARWDIKCAFDPSLVDAFIIVTSTRRTSGFCRRSGRIRRAHVIRCKRQRVTRNSDREEAAVRLKQPLTRLTLRTKVSKSVVCRIK